MKKKLTITVLALFVFFLMGGLYFVSTVQRTTNDLSKLVQMHQVEILREHLLIQVQTIQTDLNYLRNNGKILMADMRKAKEVSDSCFGCHHTKKVETQLVHLRNLIREYGDAVDKAVITRKDTHEYYRAVQTAYLLGVDLINDIDEMLKKTSGKLAAVTEASLKEIAHTRNNLFLFVALGALLAAGLTALFMRNFTRPLNTLLAATRQLMTGDLDFRIEGMQDEFKEVAASFNEMARSLKLNMDRVGQSRQDWEDTFNAITDMITIHNANYEIVRANKEAVKILGISPSNGSAKCFRYFPGLNHPPTPGTCEIFEPHLDRFLEIRTMPRSCNGNGHVGVIHIMRDITERKRTEEAMQRTEQMRGVGEIAAGLAHEIKVPLTGIMMAMESVSGKADLGEHDRIVLKQATGEVKRIKMLLRELLNFAKPPKPQMMAVDLNELLDSSLSFSVNQASYCSRTIEIVKDFDSGHPKVFADPMQLKQIFLNLFVNAADVMPDGGRLGVRSFIEPSNRAVRVEVSDTGRGIEEELQENVFQPFVTTKTKGTGLGLAVTKRLIEQHGGTIYLNSLLGIGTVFTVRIPLADVRTGRGAVSDSKGVLIG